MTIMTNDISYGPIRNTFVVALDVLVEKTSDSMNFAMNGFRLVNCCRGVKVPVKMVCHSDVVLAFKKNDKRAIAGVRKTSKTNNFLVTNQMHRNFRYYSVILTHGLYSTTLSQIIDYVALFINNSTGHNFFKIITLVLERMTKSNFCRSCHSDCEGLHRLESYNRERRSKSKRTTRSRYWWSRRLHSQQIQSEVGATA